MVKCMKSTHESMATLYLYFEFMCVKYLVNMGNNLVDRGLRSIKANFRFRSVVCSDLNWSFLFLYRDKVFLLFSDI